MSLLQHLFGETRQRATLAPLYRAVVTEGRDPAWYRDGKVPDTMDGRFDMIAAVTALVLLRLEAEGEPGRDPSVLLTELFIEDMDSTLRQLGIGDHVVGKHVGQMMSALGGRARRLPGRAGLSGGGEAQRLPRGGAFGRGGRLRRRAPGGAGARPRRRSARRSARRKADAMTAPEFSRPVRIDALGEAPQRLAVEAGESERSALAKRFGLVAIDCLAADAALSRSGEAIRASGVVTGIVTQSCVASGDPVEARIETPFELVFRPHPEAAGPDEEIELGEQELDTIFYEGGAVDLGEAVAETLFLNLDPYPRAPAAGDALAAAGVKSEEEAGPFAALAGLRDKLTK